MDASVGLVSHPLVSRPPAKQPGVSQLPVGQTEDGARNKAVATPVAATRDMAKVWTYDERINQVVVTITRVSTGEVIRQIPQAEIVEIMATLRGEARGLILDQRG